jgi:uncharacterized membrane protein
MADRAVIAVFDTQNQAYAAAADLQRLGDDGTIAIKRGAIVTKDAKGTLTIPDSRDVGAPWGLLGGGLMGGLLGALLGPAGAAAGVAAGTAAAAGAAVGAATGAAVGGSADLVALGLNEGFIDDVSADLDPGHTALIAEVDEGSTEPVDRAVQRHAGRVHRQDLTGLG